MIFIFHGNMIFYSGRSRTYSNIYSCTKKKKKIRDKPIDFSKRNENNSKNKYTYVFARHFALAQSGGNNNI